GNLDEVVRVPAPEGVSASIVVVTGLGEVKDFYDPETLRRAAGAATRALAGRRTVVLGLPTPDRDAVEAGALGALPGAYAFHGLRGRHRREGEGRGRAAGPGHRAGAPGAHRAPRAGARPRARRRHHAAPRPGQPPAERADPGRPRRHRPPRGHRGRSRGDRA